MKILIGLSYYFPNLSGLTIYAKNLAEEFAKNGHDVTVITSQYKKELVLSEKKNKVNIVRIPVSFKVGKGPLMLSFPFKVVSYIKNSDVINCHLPQFESFILVIIGKIFKKKVVLTYHASLSMEGSYFDKFVKIILSISHIISGLGADVIVSQTEDYTKNSKYLSYFRNKVIYIYPPIRPLSESNAVKLKLEKNNKQKKYYIGSVGRIASEKGFEYLISTVPMLIDGIGENFLILIAGPRNPVGEEIYLKKMEKLIEKYKDYILFLGELTEEELASFYKSIDLLVLPSINSTEAFGMVQVEAMRLGVPVVATNLPGVRMPIKITNMGELAKVRDTKDLATKIIKVISNSSIYKKNHVYIDKTFSYSQVIRNYEDCFEKK